MNHRAHFSGGRMKKGIYNLPNLFTTASLFCGFYSIIASFHGDFFKAAISIVVAFFLDGLDGKIARFTNTTSKFGAEYDSLSDLIAFGMAPALLAYTWALSPFGRYGWLVSFLFVVCGALWLARFNIQFGIVDSSVFNGLPIPGAAIVLASSVLLLDYLGEPGPVNHVSVLAGCTILSLLMVSSIKYYSFKDLNFFSKKPFMTFVMIVFLLVIIILEPEIMCFTIAVGYAASGPLWFLVRMAKKKIPGEREQKTYDHRKNW